jgi:hypothetical protein
VLEGRWGLSRRTSRMSETLPLRSPDQRPGHAVGQPQLVFQTVSGGACAPSLHQRDPAAARGAD